MRMRVTSLGWFTLLSACTPSLHERPQAIVSGATYVALGSSFAAGPGVVPSADQPPTRCTRSANNYAQTLTKTLGLRLRDVSCSGATTAHLLGPWLELPPQIDAVTADTQLVTITIGGNDVGYIGSLGSASCRNFPSTPSGTPSGKCPSPPNVSDEDWTKLHVSMRAIVAQIRRQSPASRIIFVDYLTVMPGSGLCAAVPLTEDQADASRATAQRLAMLTERVAAETATEVFKASSLSRDHSACSVEPWVTGFPLPGSPSFIPYHPNAQGMAAVAAGLARQLGR